MFIACIFISVNQLHAQELDSSAKYIKENFEADYKFSIRKHALSKWGEDFNMVVFEINKQSEALINLVSEFESKNTSIAYNAIIKWSIEGHESENDLIFKAIEKFSIKNLLKLNCDWSMVKYEYDKQVKAKNSF